MDWIFHGGVRRAVACVGSIVIKERRRAGASRSDTAASGISACYGAVFVRGGAIAGEMESATLFVVASVLHVRCGAIFMIGNNLRGSDEQMNAEKEGESQRRYYGGHQRVNQIAIDAIRLLIQRDAKENGGKL